MSTDKNPRSNKFRDSVATKEKRRICAERRGVVGTWSAFGSMGVVGWSIAFPTVLGSFLGAWMDYMWPYKVSWTLTMLGVGLFAGCVCAGMWMNKEKGKIISERDRDWLCNDDPESTDDADAMNPDLENKNDK
ncbi:AtpZ/AtpI family protein [Maridesulfovibrio frigidus]|uniref:AtpZ/AtpI family protein n=1 Tax=Maridesulfovibrio frigidus TaxID=340956 RepID=UPI00068D5FA9|nr:AtpZ/AtpI family protein [Maridesulfovibrio frigidus]